MWRCSQRMRSLTASFPSFLKVTRIILSLEMFQFYLGSSSNVLHFRYIWPHTVIVGWEHPCALWGEVGECGDLCNLHLLEQQWLNCWLASLCQLEVNHFSHQTHFRIVIRFKQTKSWKKSQSLRSSTFAASKETTTSPTPTPMQTWFCWWVEKPTQRQVLRYQVNPFNL